MKLHRAISMYVGNPSLRRLTAEWNTAEEPCNTDPCVVHWNHGTSSTVGEFRTLQLSTSCITFSKKGQMRQHLFPDIRGTVSFEEHSRAWVIRGEGIIVTALRLSDPNASDLDIFVQISHLPIVYAVVIIRI